MQFLDQRVDVSRLVHQPITLPGPGDLQRQVALLLQVVQGRDDPFARFAGRRRGGGHVDRQPFDRLGRSAQNALQESRPAGVEVLEDLRRRPVRLELVLGVERPGRRDDAEQFQVGQQRLDHQRADVVLGRPTRSATRRTRLPRPSTSATTPCTASRVGVSP